MAIPTGTPVVTSRYYSGQGRCMMGSRDPDTGKPVGLLPIGNVPAVSIGIEETTETHKESWSGQRGIDRTTVTETVVNVTMTFESLDPTNLALGLKGTVTDQSAGTAVAASVGLYPGKWMEFPHLKLSTLTLVAAGTNPNLADLVDADLEVDLDGGMVKLREDYAGTYVDGEPINFTYNHARQLDVQAMTVAESAERYFVFRGLNTDDGKQVRLTVPRLRIAPFTELGKINDGIAQVEVTCTAMADTFITTAGLSQYFSEKYEY